MARYVDADLINRKIEYICKVYIQSPTLVKKFKDALQRTPTADVVKVVRCKDCKHKVVTSDGEYNPKDIVCDYHMSDGFDSNDFCSYGERRE